MTQEFFVIRLLLSFRENLLWSAPRWGSSIYGKAVFILQLPFLQLDVWWRFLLSLRPRKSKLQSMSCVYNNSKDFHQICSRQRITYLLFLFLLCFTTRRA